jgi:hypothetical protein
MVILRCGWRGRRGRNRAAGLAVGIDLTERNAIRLPTLTSDATDAAPARTPRRGDRDTTRHRTDHDLREGFPARRAVHGAVTAHALSGMRTEPRIPQHATPTRGRVMKSHAPALAVAMLFVLPSTAIAARYTYHGELMDGDAPAAGRYDLRVRAYAQPGATKAMGEPIELPGVALVDGRFSVELDLPEDADGTTWVEVAVRAADSGDDFDKLGDPQPVSKVNGTCPGAWALDGNSGLPAGSYLGSVDPGVALELKASGRRVARLDSTLAPGYVDAPRIAQGSSANQATAIGASVLGGGASHDGDTGNPDPSATNRNLASAPFATVLGGIANTSSGGSSLSGGGGNTASGNASLALGAGNRASGQSATAMGSENTAFGEDSAALGGESNVAEGTGSTAVGGRNNCAGGDYSWAGGSYAVVRSGNQPGEVNCGATSGDADGDESAFVWADRRLDGEGLLIPFVSTGPNQFAIRASGGLRWGGTGVNSTTSPAFTHQVDTGASGNTCSGGSGVANSRTAINHPLLNGNPNAVIVMTPNYGTTASGVAPPRNPLGVYYNSGADGNCAANRWVIYDLTTSPAPLNLGAKFNLWFVLP